MIMNTVFLYREFVSVSNMITTTVLLHTMQDQRSQSQRAVLPVREITVKNPLKQESSVRTRSKKGRC